MKGRDGSGRVTEQGGQRWRERLPAGRASVWADIVVPSDPTGWVVIAGRDCAVPRPGLQATIAALSRSGLATMVLSLPPGTDTVSAAGWIHVAVNHLRDDLRQSLPIAYLGAGKAAAPGLIAAAGGAVNGVMAWNGRPGAAWGHLPAVQVPSLFVVDQQSGTLGLAARAAGWRLGVRPQIVTGVAVDNLSVLTGWYRDRLVRPPARLARPARRRLAPLAVAGVLAAAPAAALTASPAAAALPDFSAGGRLSAAQIGGDGKEVKPPHDDPPLTDGIGFRWNINTNLQVATTSSASAAVSEGAFTHAVAASTLNGGTVNQTPLDAFDGYNALCIDLNNVGGQCSTANMAVYNQNGPGALECSGRQVVTPLKTMGNFQVRRKVFVPTNEGFARWLNIIRNTSASPQTVRMVTSNNLGSDGNTRIVTTSDGDTTPELTDTWVTTFQNYVGTTSSDPRLGHVLRGLNAPVGLAGNTFADGDDNPFWRYQFTLAPGQTGIIMNFATAQGTKAAAATEAAALASLSSANALACMTQAERQQTLNFLAVPGLSIADVTSTEGDAGTKAFTFTITRQGNLDVASTVNWSTLDGSAVAPSDYISSGGALTFNPGETTKTVSVTVNGDITIEPNDGFSVILSNPVEAVLVDGTAVGRITNDDFGIFSINDVTVTEGDTGTVAATFTVTRTGTVSNAASVKWLTSPGTATAGIDYVTVPSTTLNFAGGETSKSVSVNVNGDTAVEGNETFVVRLVSPVGANLGDSSGLGRITNDDAATFSVNDATVTEGNAGPKTATFTVTRSGDIGGSATVQWSTANGTAVSGSDYVAVPLTTLTFGPGEQSKAVNVTVNGDTVYEGNETFQVRLTGATGAAITDGSGLGRITNDD